VRINGKLFLILLGSATLALAALTLWLWPRLAGRGARPVAGRIALLLGTQLSLAAAFLFTVNAFGGFYTSWGQLFGTASAQMRLADSGPATGAAANAGQLLGLAGRGRWRMVGVRSGLSVQLEVFTPSGYAAGSGGASKTGRSGEAGRSPEGDRSRDAAPVHFGAAARPSTAAHPSAAAHAPAADFPVEVVDLTGGFDGRQLPDFQRLADDYRLIVAVVSDPPDGAAIPGVNVPAGPQGELFWGQDLRAALAARYRVEQNAADWGIAGVGASGAAAINLAVQDSTRYGLAAAVGDWTGGPAQDSWPGIDRYLADVPAPAVRLLYDSSAPAIPEKIRTSDGPLLVAGQSGLDLAGAIDWLGASIEANHRVAA
jgi:hypothetical protein